MLHGLILPTPPSPLKAADVLQIQLSKKVRNSKIPTDPELTVCDSLLYFSRVVPKGSLYMPVNFLNSSPSSSAKKKLLERLESIEEKEQEVRRETEALIGKIIVNAIESEALPVADFKKFIEPFVRKKADAKKLKLLEKSELRSSDVITPPTDSQDRVSQPVPSHSTNIA